MIATATDVRARPNTADATLTIGDDDSLQIKVLSLSGEEQLGRLFSFKIIVSVEQELADALTETSFAGERAAIHFLDPDGNRRVVRGLISDGEFAGVGHSHAYYKLQLSPYVWPLTQRVNSRIFQERSTPQIIRAILKDHGLAGPGLVFALREDYAPRDYCVQYRESDWDFISRLMEEEGMYHFYRDADGEALLHITDGPHGHPDLNFGREVRFHPPEGRTPVPGTVYELTCRRQLRPGNVALTDYAAVKPSMPLETRAQRGGHDTEQAIEVFDFPGEYRTRELGGRLSRVRLQELRCGHAQAQGRGTRVDFGPGQRLSLDGHPLQRFNAEYVITRVRHRCVTPMAEALGYAGDGRAGGELIVPSYDNEFVALPQDEVFRPERATKRPRVAGPQTAVVVGPEEEEIYTDKYGRVKVRFRWDRDRQLARDARQESDASCWIRVSQPWAGVGYGGLTIPRIGQEVIVDFLEGDPDQPVITGRLYNGEAMQPTSMAGPSRMTGAGPEPIPAMQNRPQVLPESRARTTIRSNSTPGGGGANELTLDDVAGSELFHINASKDYVATIADFSTTTVGNDMKLSVGNCLFEFVAISHDAFIGINETQFIGVDRTEVVGCNETITIGMNRTEAVGMNETLSVGLNRTEIIGVDHTEAIGNDMTVTVGNDVKLVAGNSITIETGLSQIYMNRDGTITIKGKEIIIQASTSLIEESPVTSVTGATNMTVHGAATQIRGENIQVLADDLLHMESAGKLDSVAAGENVIKGGPIKLN